MTTCLRTLLRIPWLRPVAIQIPARLKYTQNQGVKGIRNRKSYYEAQMQAGQQTDNEQEFSTANGVDSLDMRFLDDR